MAITRLTIDGKRFVLLPESDYEAMRSEAALSASSVAELRRALDPALKEADAGEFAEFTCEDIIAERRAAKAGKGNRRRGV